MNDQQLKQLWRDQPAPATPISLDRVKADARRLNRAIALRNGAEYLAALVVLTGFACYLAWFPYPRMRTGSLLIIAATVFVVLQLSRRASSQRLPSGLTAEPWVVFRRAQLTRQRDALRSAWRWYLAPFVPGIVVFRWGVETELPGGPFTHGLLANAAVALVFIAIAAVTRFSARQLQRRIDRFEEQAR